MLLFLNRTNSHTRVFMNSIVKSHEHKGMKCINEFNNYSVYLPDYELFEHVSVFGFYKLFKSIINNIVNGCLNGINRLKIC